MDTEIFQEVASQQILKVAQEEEKKLDAAIEKLEKLDEDDFEILRQKRLEKLKRQQQQKAEWTFLGHGVYSELDSQQALFDAAKKSQRVVCHFYRPTTRYCQVVDAHLEKLAQKHMETRFCKINAEKSPYLVEKLNIYVMPTLVLIKDGQTVHHIRGFDELGGTDEFSTSMLAYVLSLRGVLNYDGAPPEHPTQKGMNSIRMAFADRPTSSSIRRGLQETLSDDDDDGGADSD